MPKRKASDDEVAADHLKQRERELDKRQSVLEKRESDLREAEEAFATESSEAYGNTGPDDVLSLNVGGARCDVLRRTLCCAKGSMLASKFSGRWDGGLPKDRDDNFFIDEPFELFKPLLDFFRVKSRSEDLCGGLMSIEDLDCVDSDVVATKDFQRMVDYYGCTLEVYPVVIATWVASVYKDNVEVTPYPQMTVEVKEETANPSPFFLVVNANHSRVIKSIQLVTLGHTSDLMLKVYEEGQSWESVDTRAVSIQLEPYFRGKEIEFWGLEDESWCKTVALKDDTLGDIFDKGKGSYIKEGTVVSVTFHRKEKSSVLDELLIGGKVVISQRDIKKRYGDLWAGHFGLSMSDVGRVRITDVTYHI